MFLETSSWPTLQITLQFYWTSRVRDSFKVKFHSMSIDCTGEDAQHQKQEGGTSRLNTKEATTIAWTIGDMLKFKPPAGGRQITASDIGVVTPYSAQVPEIRKQIRNLNIPGSDGVVTATSSYAQGKQWPIAFFSVVVSNGMKRLQADQRIPIAFAIDRRLINVSLSRAQVCRYIVGGLRSLVQMAVDKHPQTDRDVKSFNHIRHLYQSDRIISANEWNYTMANDGKKPTLPSQHFAKARYFQHSFTPALRQLSRTLNRRFTGEGIAIQ